MALLVGSLAGPGSAAGSACSNIQVKPEWTTISVSEFPDGPHNIVDHAIAPRRPDRTYVTNGTSVMKTEDGGCNWKGVFTLQDLPDLDMQVSKLTGRIAALMVPEEGAAQGHIFMLVEETIAGVKRPHIIASTDAGSTWELRDEGLPLVSGNALELVGAPSDAKTLYLLLQGSALSASELYASQDGGATWNKRSEIPGGVGLEVDPIDQRQIWMHGAALYFSGDGGRNFTEMKYVGPPVSTVDVFHAPGEPSRVLAYMIEGQTFNRTLDGGKTWGPIPTPPNVPLSIAHGNRSEDVIVSMHEGVYRFRAPFYWVEVTPGLEQGVRLPDDYEDIHDIQVPRVEAPSPVGRRAKTLMKYTGFQISLPPLTPSAPPAKADALLDGPDGAIKIKAGRSKKVGYKLKLPPQPTPLDVFFLVDTTASMESSIKGLLEGLQMVSQRLADADVDARFGAGEYKDYPLVGFGDPTAGDFPYRLNRDMGPADASLVAALEKMQASGGGPHQPEAQLTGLYQAATGEGEPGCASAPPAGPSPCVPPGQGATFRGEALRVIINVTDAGFEDSGAHPSPPFDVVADTLGSAGILQVGLAVFGPSGNRQAKDWLGRMAAATGTLAPPGGVDCNGDGLNDLAAGAPLVCEILDETQHGVANLAPAILASLRAITDIADVSLVARSGEEVIERISPNFEGVDVKDAQTLGFDVTYTCPDRGRSKTTVDLVGQVRDASVAGTKTKVVCLPDPEAEEEDIVPLLAELVQPPLAALAVAPPVPPPPAPVTQYQPQPNANVQAAAAHQDQEEAQVATVHQQTDEEAEESWAMTAYESRPRGFGADAFALYGAALGMAGVAAAVRLRTRTRLAQQRRGR